MFGIFKKPIKLEETKFWDYQVFDGGLYQDNITTVTKLFPYGSYLPCELTADKNNEDTVIVNIMGKCVGLIREHDGIAIRNILGKRTAKIKAKIGIIDKIENIDPDQHSFRYKIMLCISTPPKVV